MDAAERRIVGFTAGSHGLVHTYELSIPILLTVWVGEFSTTAAALGVVVTLGYGLFGVGALPGGILVDRFGSKPLILACLAGMAGSFLAVSLAPTLPVLAVAVAIWGLTASVYHPAGLSLLSTSVDQRGTALGYHGIGGNLGIALGPLATALLLLAFDWRLVTAALALPAVAVAAYGVTVDVDVALSSADPEPGASAADGGPNGDSTGGASGEVSLSSVATDTRILIAGGFLLVFAFVTFSGLYYRTFLTFLPDLLGDVLGGLVDLQLVDPESPYADQFDAGRYLYVAVLTVGVFGQFLGGRIADRVPPERGLMALMGILSALALLFIPATGTIATFVAVSLALGVALFTVQPLSQATVAAYSPSEARGLSFGYTYVGIFGIGALGSTLAGTILTRAGPSELFVVLAIIAALGAVSATAVSRFATRRD
ncbi:MFS transporter [Halorubrum ezzemoulense]|uniref:MFS transporter n=1 Tax=Halorubrum ezzemoulense TaxID=337243 RepID=A0A256JAJ1_HALEZ|nr:MFS transporter [Halorubrum ezzemoulense]MDB2245855.1 MFS transporter [Halorubrum ezzemoulense]MDB2252879.1 MFS transporter [Halorubrum ezzemoulense]MDB2279503.1 MFS transporter [Halorubrum ezzemoulense]MDB2286901.1 MFS transporter [Halorubrum ezzemoulense]MDB2289728.1 MFS transporter [Halorubrum ezzemoulense]